MQDFEDLMEMVTVTRITLVQDSTKARQEMQETTFDILANIQPMQSNANGSSTTERTLDKGSYYLGEIMITTSENLQASESKTPDIITYEGNKYEITIKKIYKEPLAHFEYICSIKL